MQIGMVGLGKMGSNMVRRLLRAGHECAVHDLDPGNVQRLAGEGARGCATLDELVAGLEKPRAVWVMVPAGAPTESAVHELGERLEAGDIVVDGGNSFFQDDVRRAKALAAKGIRFVDAGTSGGVWGAERGYCLMVGGEPEAVARLEPVLRALAPGRGTIPRTPGRESAAGAGGSGDPAGSAGSGRAEGMASRAGTAEEGYLHCGPVGSGHFVKMVHNGIEYGLMQAYAEGFELLRSARGEGVPKEHRYDLDLAAIAEVWRRGSVIGSWLLDLTAAALLEDPSLDGFEGRVSDSGEGRWTLLTAIERAVPAGVLSVALDARFRSRRDHLFSEKLLSAMRHQFGGHVERPSKA